MDGGLAWPSNFEPGNEAHNGGIMATPALSGDGSVLYIGGVLGLYALHASSGALIWNYTKLGLKPSAE